MINIIEESSMFVTDGKWTSVDYTEVNTTIKKPIKEEKGNMKNKFIFFSLCCLESSYF